jgi:hypothetical protein
MRTQVNPGSLLEVTGSFELVTLNPPSELGDLAEAFEPQVVVVDRESQHTINLVDLLRSFIEDPSDTVTGPIRIRIESAMISPGSAFPEMPPVVVFLADDPGGLWREGTLAIDAGPEAPGSPVRSFQVIGSGEILSLSSAYEDGLVQRVSG